jgi:cytochrome c oxidase subunit 1
MRQEDRHDGGRPFWIRQPVESSNSDGWLAKLVRDGGSQTHRRVVRGDRFCVSSSSAASRHLIVTALNLRAPGMTLMRMPVFAWMTLITSMLTLFAMPIIGVALWMLLFDLRFGSNFFQPAAGGDPMLWQHLFWLFGHPEVYIMALPAFGTVSEVMPTFARKPLFGYPVMVFSGVAIAFIGFGVGASHVHHSSRFRAWSSPCPPA